jgi:hypothetical protein
MTKQQIEKGNILIAMFLGWSYGHPDKKETRWADQWFEMEDGVHTYRHEVLLFDVDWNWLITACKRWDDLRMKSIPIAKNYTLKEVEAMYVDLCEGLDNAVSCYEILPAFEQLVACIKWYNKISKAK